MRFSRRTLLRGALGAAGASALPGVARADGVAEKSTVVVVNLPGGLHSLFAQADSFLPRGLFGCTTANTRDLGAGRVVDTATFGTLPDDVLARMCNLGVWHGISAHDLAQKVLLTGGPLRSYPLLLAQAMGGQAPVACANVGLPLAGRHEAMGAVSVQRLSDAGGVLTALGASPGGDLVPSREAALLGLRTSARLSAATLAKNQRSLGSLTAAMGSVVRALAAPPVQLDWASIAAAYGLSPDSTQISGFASQFATAELLIHAGTNVVMVSARGPSCTLGWDTHSDREGVCARSGLQDLLLPSLRTFLSRTLNLPGHNVVTALIGDFTRTPFSEHAGNLVASAWGPHLIPGSTGGFTIDSRNYDAHQPTGGVRAGIEGFWSFLAEAAGAPLNPFGANPHPFVG